MITKDILNELWDIATFKQEILQIRMLMRMSDDEFNFLSKQISNIANNARISAPEIAQIIVGGAMRGFQLSELPNFLKFTINAMFALNESTNTAGHWTGLLANVPQYDQDIADSADSVLRSIVYLTNVINGNIMFVK